MTPERYQRISEVFAAVRRLPVDERSAYLDQACADDDELRRNVEAFLDQENSTQFSLQPDAVRKSLSRLAAASLDHEDTAGQPATIGRYRIIQEIARGGMGIVYLAEQDQPKREVALKVIRPEMMTRQTLRRFEHEAYVLGQLQHPGIAQVYEAGVADIETRHGATTRQPFFAMEFIRGEPLDQYARNRGLDVKLKLELVARICEGVHHAHQKGVVHRDLKPANVMVVDQAAVSSATSNAPPRPHTSLPLPLGQPKILDFGIARATDSDLQNVTTQTDIGKIIGTVPYMSPEQVSSRSDELDTRSDIYALGVILFELLTGKLPYDIRDRSVPDAIRTICETDPTRLGSVDPHLRGDAEIIVAKALEKDKDRRYGSAAEMAADIRRYLRDEPIVARSPSVTYQFRKFAKRHRAVVISGVAVMVILIAASVFSSLRAIREIKQRQIAEKRFNDVRQLAGTFIFDVEEKIRYLPGSTEGRALLVKTALRYLDELAAESHGEPDLLLELAQAYRRVGNVQAGQGMPNLGDTAGALDSYRKCLAILERLGGETATDPAIAHEMFGALLALVDVFESLGKPDQALANLDRAHRVAAVSKLESGGLPAQAFSSYKTGRIYERTGRPAEALTHYLESHALREAAHRADPDNLMTMRAVAITSNKLGDMYARDGRLEEALARYRESHQIRLQMVKAEPDHAVHQRDLSLTHGRLGETLSKIGRMDQALVHLEAYRQIRANMAAADPENARAQRDLAISRTALGKVYRKMGRLDDAMKNLADATGALRKLTQADPENFALRHDLSQTNLAACEVLVDMERFEEALTDSTACLAIIETLANVNQSNTEVKRSLGAAYVVIGRVLHGLNRFEDARGKILASLRVRESLVEIDQDRTLFQFDLLETLRWLARVCIALAKDDGPRTQQLAFWREARSYCHDGRKLAISLQDRGLLDADHAALADELDAMIDECDRATDQIEHQTSLPATTAGNS